MPKPAFPPESLVRYRAFVARVPGIEVKGASLPYTSVHGHMFSFLDKDGRIGLRLDRENREAFLAANDSHLMEANGTILKEYVFVPAHLAESELSAGWLERSLAYVGGLKPKATKR